MAVLAICISVNVMIAIIFKLFPHFRVNTFHAIVFNYLTCLGVGSFQLGEFPIPSDFISRPWFPYVIFLGFLFVSGFNMNAMSTQKIGISYTSLIQKLSLIIPAAVAIVFFDEVTTLLKVLGIIGAIIAIIFIQLPSKTERGTDSVFKKHASLVLGVFSIAATIEVLLYYMNAKGISSGSDISVVSSIFGTAGFIGLIIMVYRIATGKSSFHFRNVIAGVILGIPNFYSIYLLVYLLADGWEGSVLFPINNVGIIALSAMVAVIFFREKLNVFKWIGLLLAIVSILLISL